MATLYQSDDAFYKTLKGQFGCFSFMCHGTAEIWEAADLGTLQLQVLQIFLI